jgi:hypothetical protein
MPKRKKTARDMTNEELARDVFPKKVVEELKKVARESEKKPKSHKTDSSRKSV